MAKVTSSNAGHNALVNEQQKRIRPALQARSQETQRRILEVVDSLVREGRYETATIADITRAAQCSVGAFYGRFSDKDAALLDFYSRRCDELEEALLTVLEQPISTKLRVLIREFIEVLISHSFQYREFLLAFQSRFTSRDTEFLARTRTMNGRLIGALKTSLELRSDEFRHPDSETAALFTLAIAGGLTRDAILFATRIVNKETLSLDFADEMERAIVGYLGCV